jgi:hypothetical protein
MDWRVVGISHDRGEIGKNAGYGSSNQASTRPPRYNSIWRSNDVKRHRNKRGYVQFATRNFFGVSALRLWFIRRTRTLQVWVVRLA